MGVAEKIPENHEGGNATRAKETRPPALYDPALVGKLGLLFTPAFSAYFSMRNWEALGNPREAKRQKLWFQSGVALLAGSFALGYSDHALAELVFNLALIAFLCVWYFGPQKEQTAHVRAHWGDAYPTRPLIVPALVAGAVGVALLASMFGRSMEKATMILEKAGFPAAPADRTP